MTESKKVALIDLDGTLCDFNGALARDLATLAAPDEGNVHSNLDEELDPPHLRARKHLIKSQTGWWRALKPLPLGFEILEALIAAGFAPHVLTRGPRRVDSAWSEKMAWCRQYLPGVPVTITADKGLVYGVTLVDDYPPYIVRWLEWRPRGKVIMPAQPWNATFTHPDVLRYTGENPEALRAFIRDMAERDTDRGSLDARKAV